MCLLYFGELDFKRLAQKYCINEITFLGNQIPLCKAKYCQEQFSDLLIVVRTADENLIHQNTANTSRLIWRGCVMIFELKSCLHVNSIPWKKVLDFFQNGGFFLIANFFWKICIFANISWFCEEISRILFHLKALYTRI